MTKVYFNKRNKLGQFSKRGSKGTPLATAVVNKSTAKAKTAVAGKGKFTIQDLALMNKAVRGSGLSKTAHPNRQFSTAVFTGKGGTFFLFTEDGGEVFNVREFYTDGPSKGHTSYSTCRKYAGEKAAKTAAKIFSQVGPGAENAASAVEHAEQTLEEAEAVASAAEVALEQALDKADAVEDLPKNLCN